MKMLLHVFVLGLLAPAVASISAPGRVDMTVDNGCENFDCGAPAELWWINPPTGRPVLLGETIVHTTFHVFAAHQFVVQLQPLIASNYTMMSTEPFNGFNGLVTVEKNGVLGEDMAYLPFDTQARGYLTFPVLRRILHADPGVQVGARYGPRFVEHVASLRERCPYWPTGGPEALVRRDCSDENLLRCGLVLTHLLPHAEIKAIWQRDYQARMAFYNKNIDRLPYYTETGYKIDKISPAVLETLQAKLASINDEWTLETRTIDSILSCHEADTWVWWIRPKEIEDMMVDECRTKLTAWLGWEEGDILLTRTYGWRTFKRGAQIHRHGDRHGDDYILSVACIFHLEATNMEEPWKLEVQRKGTTPLHTVETRPGDLLLYESATLEHGRHGPLKGEQIVNGLVHMRPKKWEFRTVVNEL